MMKSYYHNAVILIIHSLFYNIAEKQSLVSVNIFSKSNRVASSFIMASVTKPIFTPSSYRNRRKGELLAVQRASHCSTSVLFLGYPQFDTCFHQYSVVCYMYHGYHMLGCASPHLLAITAAPPHLQRLWDTLRRGAPALWDKPEPP